MCYFSNALFPMLSPRQVFLDALIIVCHTYFCNWSAPSVTNVQLLKNDFYSKIKNLYGLIRLISFTMHFVIKAMPIDTFLWYVLKLTQLNIQVQYHVNVIYSLRDEHTAWKNRSLKIKFLWVAHENCAPTAPLFWHLHSYATCS